MQMGVVEQILAPSMKNGDKSDLCAEILRVSRGFLKGFTCGAKENFIESSFVM
jgi:hypothetical protein